jgi:hypothetical protein
MEGASDKRKHLHFHNARMMRRQKRYGSSKFFNHPQLTTSFKSHFPEGRVVAGSESNKANSILQTLQFFADGCAAEKQSPSGILISNSEKLGGL